MKENFLLPNIFNPFALKVAVEAFEGISRLRADLYLQPPYNSAMIASSLERFSRSFVSSGDFTDLVCKYLSNNSTLDPKKFSLLSHTGHYFGHTFPFNMFYFDGFASLVLIYGKPEDNNLVTTSLEMIGNGKGFEGMNMQGLRENDLIINQIQGPLSNYHSPVGITFGNFRWERLMLEMFINWGIKAGIDRLFVLPAAYNQWDKVKNNENNTAKLRYDVTATRMGFRRNSIDEPYEVNLYSATNDLFEIFLQGVI